MKNLLLPALALGLFSAPMLPSAAHAQTTASAEQICNRMISEGRGGGQSVADCVCMHRVAEAVLDADILSLLRASWYTGVDNMDALSRLPNRNRIERQFRTMERTLQANCG